MFGPFGPGDFIAGPVMMGPSPAYIEDLQRRKAIITRLCTALHEFLAADIDMQLQRAMEPAPTFIPRKPSIQEWEAATREVEKIEGQIEALLNMAENLPEEHANYFEKLQMPMLEDQLAQAKSWVARIQEAMETPPAALPNVPDLPQADQPTKKENPS